VIAIVLVITDRVRISYPSDLPLLLFCLHCVSTCCWLGGRQVSYQDWLIAQLQPKAGEKAQNFLSSIKWLFVGGVGRWLFSSAIGTVIRTVALRVAAVPGLKLLSAMMCALLPSPSGQCDGSVSLAVYLLVPPAKDACFHTRRPVN
jgi:hypothetical protein